MEPHQLPVESRLPSMTEDVGLQGHFLLMWCATVCGSKYKTAPCLGFWYMGKECIERTRSVRGGRAGTGQDHREKGICLCLSTSLCPLPAPSVLLWALLTQRYSVTVGQACWWPHYLAPDALPSQTTSLGSCPTGVCTMTRAGLQGPRPGL